MRRNRPTSSVAVKYFVGSWLSCRLGRSISPVLWMAGTLTLTLAKFSICERWPSNTLRLVLGLGARRGDEDVVVAGDLVVAGTGRDLRPQQIMRIGGLRSRRRRGRAHATAAMRSETQYIRQTPTSRPPGCDKGVDAKTVAGPSAISGRSTAIACCAQARTAAGRPGCWRRAAPRASAGCRARRS